MSFYRLFVSAIAAMAITAPVFADDTSSMGATSDQTQAQPATPSDTQATGDQHSTSNTAQQAQVDLNKASVSDLMRVKGLSASKARAIVAYRKKHGDFKTVNDLAKVKGFTHMKSDDFTAITAQFSV